MLTEPVLCPPGEKRKLPCQEHQVTLTPGPQPSLLRLSLPLFGFVHPSTRPQTLVLLAPVTSSEYAWAHGPYRLHLVPSLPVAFLRRTRGMHLPSWAAAGPGPGSPAPVDRTLRPGRPAPPEGSPTQTPRPPAAPHARRAPWLGHAPEGFLSVAHPLKLLPHRPSVCPADLLKPLTSTSREHGVTWVRVLLLTAARGAFAFL